MNVTLESGQLAKRDGFKQFEDAVSSTKAILFMDIAHFTDGKTFVIVKLTDGKLYKRQVEPTDAGTFTVFRTGHSATDVGWSYMWADRWFYFDGTATTRWDGTTAYTQAGISKPGTVLPTLSAVAGGAMEGTYHVYAAGRNSVTGEEGNYSEASLGTETRLSIDDGGLLIGNMAAIRGAIEGEFDKIVFYRDFGNAGFMGLNGAGSSYPTYQAFEDLEFAKTASDPGLQKGDSALPTERPMLNTGGTPPPSAVGVFNGRYGVYWPSANGGKLQFSLPDFPTLVPATQRYNVLNNGATVIAPRPWVGNTGSGAAGAKTAIVFGGGATFLFTPTSTWEIGIAGDARIFTKQRHGSKGCAAIGGCVGTPAAVHAIGHRSWLLVTADGVVDLALERFSSTLAEIPVGSQDKTRMGYYSFKDQVWAAVVQTGQTLAKRILIWDRRVGDRGALTIYEPKNLAVGEGITAIVELTVATATPTMLLGTNLGRIIQFPDLANAKDETVNYAATWRGYYGQSGAGREQVLDGIDVHAGANVGTNTGGSVTITTVPMRSGQDLQYESAAQAQPLMDSTNIIPGLSVIADKQWARMWRVQLSSDATVATKWDIPGITVRITKT